MGYPPGPPVPDQIAGLTGPPPGQPASIPIGGGGPGGPPDGGGGPPPELMAALMGGGGGPPDQGPTGGPGEGGSPRSPLDILGEVRDLLMEYMQTENDDIDKKTGAALLKGVQDLFAKDQSDQEAAQGTTAAHRGMAKAIAR